MRFFIPGIIAGIILNIFLFSPINGIEIYPEWTGTLKGISSIEKNENNSKASRLKEVKFRLINGSNLYQLGGDGSLIHSASAVNRIIASSGSGEYYITYEKVGSSMEFYRITGEPYWKLDSREYPYLSQNGKLIFLMNGDQSSIRFYDFNGNPTGSEKVVGRLCTVISFSERADFGGIGFLDGSFYVVDPHGVIIYSDAAPAGNMVKSMALSPGGKYVAVHHGSPDGDRIRIINIEEKKSRDIDTVTVHAVKTALFITDKGLVTYLDRNYLVQTDRKGRILFRIKIPERRPGYAALDFRKGLYSAGYTTKSGYARIMLFREDGTILLSREFPTESFIRVALRENLLFLRGSDNLFCYSLHGGAVE